jgi:transcriptional regulator with XRE-family HTH domain
VGRPAKNQNHPVTRLRKALSTPNDEVTREDLANRCGIPAPSLRDIETGKYQLTHEVALKLAYATGVDYDSLIRGDDPLMDMIGNPLNPESPSCLADAWTPENTQSLETLFSCILKAAEKKKGEGVKVGLSFAMWAKQVSATFDMDKRVFEELWMATDSFDPQLIPRVLWADHFEQKFKQLSERRSRSAKVSSAESPKTSRRRLS